MWCFSGNRLLRECFAENRHVVFFWKLPGKRACDVLLEQMLERTHDVWKGYKYNPTDSGPCCVTLIWHATLCWFSLGFADAGLHWWLCEVLVHLAFSADHHLLWLHSGKFNKNLLVIFYPLQQIQANRQIHEISSGLNNHCWWLAVGLSYCCWFVWAELLTSWQWRLDSP